MVNESNTAAPALSAPAPDWKDIETRYLTGEELGSIAADYDVTPKSISQRAWRYNWKAQQVKLLEKHRKEIEAEVRSCFAVAVLRDARAFLRLDTPADAQEHLTRIKAKREALALAAQLFAWDAAPAGPKRVACLDV